MKNGQKSDICDHSFLGCDHKIRDAGKNHWVLEEAGGRAHLENWMPAEEISAFNNAIVGQIVVTQAFR